LRKVQEGEWIKERYRVLKGFPFVIGTLYYTEYHCGQDEVHTRFVHALDLQLVNADFDPKSLLHRDEHVFFPIREVFSDETKGLLFQVFRRLEGTLLAHYLGTHAPLSLKETVNLGRKVIQHLLRLYEIGQFTLVHPQNMVLTSGRSLRFLYGGNKGELPKGFAGSVSGNTSADRIYDTYTVGALLYQMLTGKNPTAQGLTIPSVSQYRRDCPAELDEFVQRSISFDIHKRPHIEEIADFLDWMAERLEKRLEEKNE
jgi:serine/threonine protein kinase